MENFKKFLTEAQKDDYEVGEEVSEQARVLHGAIAKFKV